MHKLIQHLLRVVRWGLSGGVVFSWVAHAASFDCVKARTQVEKMICSDVDLSRLDEDIASKYATARKVDNKGASVRQAQKQWVKERNSCLDVTCSKHAYASRISLLTETLVGSYSFSDLPENEDASSLAVCKDFMENLKRLGNPPRKFHPSMTQFAWPQWKVIDALKHRDLVEQIWQNEYGWAREEHLRASFETRARSEEIALAVAQIPIDGKSTTILRYINGNKKSPCEPEYRDSTYPSRQYFVVDSKLQKISLGMTYKSVLNGYFSYSKEMRPDIFLYKGKPRTAFGNMQGVGKGIIEISGDHRNFCHINSTSNAEREKS